MEVKGSGEVRMERGQGKKKNVFSILGLRGLFRCVLVLSKTGLLAVDKTGSKELEDIAESLKSAGVQYESLSAHSLRVRYPSLFFNESFSAVFDPTGGVLIADKCLTALQV